MYKILRYMVHIGMYTGTTYMLSPQVLLDDHIVKTQTMRGSPYIKPFEEQMGEFCVSSDGSST